MAHERHGLSSRSFCADFFKKRPLFFIYETKFMAKQRVDLMLVARGLVESRAKAQALIMAGLVYAGTARVQKAGDMLPEDAALSVKGQEHPWVSRGGVKLAHGLAQFVVARQS